MSEPMLVFGLVASSPNGALAEAFDELSTWCAEHTDVRFDLRVAPTYQELAASMREGTSDVAWLPPVAYAWLVEAVAPLGSIVRHGETSYSSALLVPNDSPIQSVSQLQGARVGWVDPWSAAGYVVPRIELARVGLVGHEVFASEKFFGSHRDVVVALAGAECDAVATYARLAVADTNVEGPWEASQARVLATFGPIPPDVLAARRNLAPASYDAASAAFAAASTDAIGQRLLSRVFGGESLDTSPHEGHEVLRLAYESAMAHGVFD